MVRKSTSPFDNPWLSAIDSTEKKLTCYASFLPPVSRPAAPDTSPSRRVAPASALSVETELRRANDWLVEGHDARATHEGDGAEPTGEAYGVLLPTLARISQRRRTQHSEPISASGLDESVEVALRVVRKQRAGRRKP